MKTPGEFLSSTIWCFTCHLSKDPTNATDDPPYFHCTSTVLVVKGILVGVSIVGPDLSNSEDCLVSNLVDEEESILSCVLIFFSYIRDVNLFPGGNRIGDC